MSGIITTLVNKNSSQLLLK